jgi:hypothetical protein
MCTPRHISTIALNGFDIINMIYKIIRLPRIYIITINNSLCYGNLQSLIAVHRLHIFKIFEFLIILQNFAQNVRINV